MKKTMTTSGTNDPRLFSSRTLGSGIPDDVAEHNYRFTEDCPIARHRPSLQNSKYASRVILSIILISITQHAKQAFMVTFDLGDSDCCIVAYKMNMLYHNVDIVRVIFKLCFVCAHSFCDFGAHQNSYGSDLLHQRKADPT